MTLLPIARDYITRGWSPIPISVREKGPRIRDWPDLRVTLDNVHEHFTHAPQNIGVLLGEPSGMLVDIDLDCVEAIEFAHRILPPTATFGRKSKPHSHWLYKSAVHRSIPFKDPNAKNTGNSEMLLEVRGTGSQTVFPGSTHVDGESIEWTDSEFAVTEYLEPHLLKQARFLAGVCLLKRYWPAKGGRHDAALALIGVLCARGVSPELIADITTAVNEGESYRKHLALAKDGTARIADDRPVQGIPSLRLALGELVANKVLEWFGFITPKPTATEVAEWVSLLSSESTSEQTAQVIELLGTARLSALQTDELLGAIAKRTGKSIRALRKDLGSNNGKREEDTDMTQAKMLVQLGQGAELFLDDMRGDAFASISQDGHTEHHRVLGKQFKEWLVTAYYHQTASVPDSATVSNAVHVLSSLARIDGLRFPVWLRVARHEGDIYVDLGDESWRAVRITRDGWSIVETPPVRFRRASGLALPEPVVGGSIKDFRRFVNSTDSGFQLVVGFLVNAFIPDKPFPILQIVGEKGTAKSTLLGLIRQLVDPAPAPGAGLPRTEDDLVVTAQSNWLVSGDNVSQIQHYMADALCRLSTGGGLKKRALYTNDEEFAIDVKRPVALTALTSVTSREDFLDRVVMVTLERIEEGRRTEEDVLAEFSLLRPGILGALFDGVAAGLRRLPAIEIENLPRMADFVKFATAAGAAYGWEDHEFIDAYENMREAVFEESAMSDPFLRLIKEWLDSQQPGYPGYDGSPSKLLQELGIFADSRDPFLRRSKQWPKSDAALVRKLRTGCSGLLQLGVNATTTRTNDNKSRVVVTWFGQRPDEPPF